MDFYVYPSSDQILIHVIMIELGEKNVLVRPITVYLQRLHLFECDFYSINIVTVSMR